MFGMIIAIPSSVAIWAYASERKEHSEDGYIPKRVKSRLGRRDGGRCVQCNSELGVDFYHIIPVSQGGSNAEENVQLLCKWCGREKNARSM